jgi:hypothetical protein
MSHSMTDPAGQTCEHGVRWAFDCAQCGEFGETLQFCSSPKLSTNSAWKLVPVEPTDAMLDAMQESALVSFDAAIEAELNNGPAVESLHRVVYRAMLAAAPEAPSADCCTRATCRIGQRVPLTGNEILQRLALSPPLPSIWPHLRGDALLGNVQAAVIAIARVVERAHGIGGSDE